MPSRSQDLATAALKSFGATVAFCILGRGRGEREWSEIAVVANHRRDANSRWPLWRNHCMTLTANLIAVGWTHAAALLAEQRMTPASAAEPVRVCGGRLRDAVRRAAVGADCGVSLSELMAHECGHTAQARRMGFLYWPIVGAVTLFREGPHWWQRYENEASEHGEFAGILDGTIHPRLLS